MVLEAHNIIKNFETTKVLKGVNFTLKKGEIISLLGTSGAGKTTLLSILGTFEKPTSGELLVQGKKRFFLERCYAFKI